MWSGWNSWVTECVTSGLESQHSRAPKVYRPERDYHVPVARKDCMEVDCDVSTPPNCYHEHEYKRPAPPVRRAERKYYRPEPPDCIPECDCHKKKLNKIKTMLVVAETKIQKVGALLVDAPIGVEWDNTKGAISHHIHLEPLGDPVFRPVVLKNKLVNEGFITVRMTVIDNDPMPCPDVRKFQPVTVVIPFQSIHDIHGICPGDHVHEFAKVEGLLVSGVPCPAKAHQAGTSLQLDIKAILAVRIIVSRECILSVPGTIKCFLSPDGEDNVEVE